MGKTTDKAPGDLPVQEDKRIPLPMPEGGWPADEFTGLGGDYVRDPVTGKRSPAVPSV